MLINDLRPFQDTPTGLGLGSPFRRHAWTWTLEYNHCDCFEARKSLDSSLGRRTSCILDLKWLGNLNIRESDHTMFAMVVSISMSQIRWETSTLPRGSLIYYTLSHTVTSEKMSCLSFASIKLFHWFTSPPPWIHECQMGSEFNHQWTYLDCAWATRASWCWYGTRMWCRPRARSEWRWMKASNGR